MSVRLSFPPSAVVGEPGRGLSRIYSVKMGEEEGCRTAGFSRNRGMSAVRKVFRAEDAFSARLKKGEGGGGMGLSLLSPLALGRKRDHKGISPGPGREKEREKNPAS